MTGGWIQLWHQFTALLTQQPVGIVLAVWIAIALIVVMAMEGVIVNLFPAYVFRRYIVRKPEQARAPVPPPRPVPAPVLTGPLEVPVMVPPPEPLSESSPEPLPDPLPAPLPGAADAALKSRSGRNRNRKKPGPGPKIIRNGWRRSSPPERLSRGIPKLLAPKN